MTCLSDYGVTIMSQCGYTACENSKHYWQKKQDPNENISLKTTWPTELTGIDNG